jgi:hypothetical protein
VKKSHIKKHFTSQVGEHILISKAKLEIMLKKVNGANFFKDVQRISRA